MNPFVSRRDRLRDVLVEQGCEAILVTNFTNVSYLTGFTGDDSFLLVTRESELLFSDPRYDQQLTEQCAGLEVFLRKPGELLFEVVCEHINRRGMSSLLVEGDSLTVNFFQNFQKQLRFKPVTGTPETVAAEADPKSGLVQGSGIIEALRMIKDETEIAAIRRSVHLAERVYASIRAMLGARQTEREIANEIERLTRAAGGSGCSFAPIVAVGPRSALPHAPPGDDAVGSSGFLLLDWGATLGGYRSDLTRMLTTSKIATRFSEVYEAVLSAQQTAIAAMEPGVMVSVIDRVARDVLAERGMGDHFTHGLGHGIGLDIHEAPRLHPSHDRPLEVGMVITVEPGVYYPGWGGIRIEDDVLITADGCEVLSTLPRGLQDTCVELFG